MKDSLLLTEIDGGDAVVEQFANVARPAASVTKVFYALELARRVVEGEMKDELVDVSGSEVVDEEGSNVLKDILRGGGRLSLKMSVVVGLMLKYSCNGSTVVLFRNYFTDIKKLMRVAKEVWGLKDIELVNKKGDWLNLMSLRDISSLYKELYGESPKQDYGHLGDLIRDSLRESRNIYYLFDQLEVKVLGSKTGTGINENGYVINDSGVMKIGGKKYFWGAMVERKKISGAVKKIRSYGSMYKDRL